MSVITPREHYHLEALIERRFDCVEKKIDKLLLIEESNHTPRIVCMKPIADNLWVDDKGITWKRFGATSWVDRKGNPVKSKWDEEECLK